ncbi:uncharacterized protein LODBEIA_P01420 [Lodderomyces beijingensis]|uniref:Uncharacterized protein n=1 Tax=Lodderomyces beijingensis TaxID=1775926 RepID=A0ABP0ZCL3_9ASCO
MPASTSATAGASPTLDLRQFNEATLQSLLAQLDKIYSTNNLLVLDPTLSSLINRLTSFSTIKEHGKCQNVTWLNDDLASIPANVFAKYSSLVFILPESQNALSKLKNYTKSISQSVSSSIKFNIVVKDLTRRFLLQINRQFDGIGDFEKVLSLPNLSKPFAITSKIKVFNWCTDPIYSDGVLITTNGASLAGIHDYFERPLKQMNQLIDALIKVLFVGVKHETKHKHLFKLRNVYAKGSHASLLVEMLINSKIPEYLNENMQPTEIEFYTEKLHSNTDLVVVERNLDFFPVVFNQLNYHGIVDDLFGINFENIVDFNENVGKDLSHDDLYNNDLKHLNFSTVGSRLNTLAKFIKQQFEDSGHKDEANISEMKALVMALGNLSVQQELIRKHTVIGENVVKKVEKEYEKFLTFQNDIFDMDYKLQISKLKSFINLNYPIDNIWTILLLIGYINDGILNKDLDKISNELQDNFGLEAALALQKIVDLKLIRVINDSSNDFFTSLGLTSQKKRTPVPQREDEETTLGITGGRDVFKSNYTLINKFWNLHPLQEEGDGIKDDSKKADNQESTSLTTLYPAPSFTLPGGTVPLIYRLVESLYLRDFLKYKPINNLKRRPNWDNLGLNTMFAGRTLDLNLQNVNDDKSKYLVVVVMGGITRSEITCFKYLEEKLKERGNHKEIIILSSGIVNHRKFWSFIGQ